ncbi:uncharacterized protein PG998_002415 [Apiospora kogelbergensis]|uniref:uncharacterized protein n=1 Tax=Apiospora kogelbergensis TaxID=1337665 RepID=UPI00312F6704
MSASSLMQDLADIGFIGDGHRLNVTMARSIQFEITTMQPSMWEDVTKPSSKDHTKHLLGIYSALEKAIFGVQKGIGQQATGPASNLPRGHLGDFSKNEACAGNGTSRRSPTSLTAGQYRRQGKFRHRATHLPTRSIWNDDDAFAYRGRGNSHADAAGVFLFDHPVSKPS